MTRYYDPEVGRFISADDFDVLLSTPEELSDKNLYAYCDNNPIVRYDFVGEAWKDVFLVVAVVAFVVAIGAVIVLSGGTAAVAVAGVVGVSMTTVTTTAASVGMFSATTAIASSVAAIVTSKSDPFARPNQKKQGREKKEKKKNDEKDWEDRSGKRRPTPPKKHTPGNDHKKYNKSIK